MNYSDALYFLVILHYCYFFLNSLTSFSLEIEIYFIITQIKIKIKLFLIQNVY